MRNPIAPWLISTKVSPPRQLLGACRREKLIHRLVHEHASPVTLLEAPAGFGKTFLLSQWRQELKSDACVIAWASIDRSDEPDSLMQYIAYAFHVAGLPMDSTGLLSPSFHGARTDYDLGYFLQRIENTPKHCVLMLDDVEHISSPIIEGILQPLIRLLPDNLSLIMACRQNPGIRLSHLSVQGALTSLGAQELRFDSREINALFGRTLSRRQMDLIMQRTDGWPVAVQLLKSLVGDADHLSRALSRYSGDSREMAVYFREQLLHHLSDQQRDFLYDVSILNPIHLDCADFIRGALNSRAIRQQLAYLEGILMPLEVDDLSYRLHPLVREYLQGKLRDKAHKKYLQLCQSAAHWMASRGQGLDAMRFALQGDNVPLAAEIFERMRGGPQLCFLEGMSRLRMGLDLLAGHNVDAFPRIHLARSLVYAKNGQMKKARASFDLAGALSNGFEKDRAGGDDRSLLIDRHIIELMLTEYGCAPPTEALKRDSLKSIQDNVDNDTLIYAYIMTLQCLTHMQSGSFAACIRSGRQAIRHFKKNNSKYGELFIYFHFGMAHLIRIETGRALAEYEKAHRMARTEFPGDMGLKRIGHVVLGEFFWEMGDGLQAGKHLKPVMNDVQHPEAWFDIYMAGYQTTAEYIFHDVGIDAALLFLDKAKNHAIEQELIRLERFLNAVRANLLYFAGKVDADFDYLSNIDTLLDDPRIRTTWREIETICLANARLAILHHDYQQAASRIDYLMNAAQKSDNKRLAIHALIQYSIIHEYTGLQSEAMSRLMAAVNIARLGKYVRPFLQEIALLQPVLKLILAENEIDKTELDFIHFLNSRSVNPLRETEPAAAFSARELQILHELSRGESDKHIARTIGMTAHGVRYHLKKIYAKLGVGNRMQAINKSRHSGLIDTAG